MVTETMESATNSESLHSQSTEDGDLPPTGRFEFNNHESHFAKTVLDYSNTRSSSDAEIVGNDGRHSMPLHSVVLAASSTLLSEVLGEVLDHTVKRPQFIVPELDQSVLSGFVSFVYRGVNYGSQGNCAALLELLTALRIDPGGAGFQLASCDPNCDEGDDRKPLFVDAGCGDSVFRPARFESLLQCDLVDSSLANVAAAAAATSSTLNGSICGEDDNDGHFDDSSLARDNVISPRTATETLLSNSETLSLDNVTTMKQENNENVPKSRAFRLRRRRKMKLKMLRRMRKSGSDVLKPYVCPICKLRKFSSTWSLNDHIRRHTNSEPSYECSFCTATFAAKRSYQRHLQKHSEANEFTSAEQSSENRPKSEAVAESQHDEDLSTDKPESPARPPSPMTKLKMKRKRRALERGLASGGGPRPLRERVPLAVIGELGANFTCGVCAQDFSDQKLLRAHVRSAHEGNRPLAKCPICLKTFQTKSARNVHLRIHTNDKRFVCTVCNKRFLRLAHLELHSRIHTGERPFACDICSKRFTDDSTCRRHRRTHSAEKPYLCTTCGARFCGNDRLKAHQRIHNGPYRTSNPDAKTYMCNTCNRGFPSENILKDHQNIHLNLKPYVCENCADSFHRKYTLHMHLRKVHAIGKPIPEKETVCVCKTCGKVFTHAGTLKIHERIHSGELPYGCTLCTKRFNYSTTLRTHMCNVHTGEKPYKCDQCSKAYADGSSLSKHKITHSAVRPFACLTCGRAFTRKHLLTAHQRIHTGEQPYTCNCGKKYSSKRDLNKHQASQQCTTINA